MHNDNEEPMAKVAGKLIQSKKFLEQNNLLDTNIFEGFGSKKNIKWSCGKIEKNLYKWLYNKKEK